MRSGARVQGGGELGESCGARGSVDGGGRSGHGCGGEGGEGSHEGEPACAGEGVSACDGGCPAPALKTSSPSCDPSCSCFHWRWGPDGEPKQLSVSIKNRR